MRSNKRMASVDAELVKELMPLIIEAHLFCLNNAAGKNHANAAPINLTVTRQVRGK